MDWIDSQLRQWWILLPVCWLAGVIFFLIKRNTRTEMKEYWEKLKPVAFDTFLITCMGVFLVIFPWQVLKWLVHLFKH